MATLKSPSAALLALFALTAALPAAAESLRCNGQIVAEGDGSLDLLARCGQPALRHAFCAPVQAVRMIGTRRLQITEVMPQCEMKEAWRYERGDGHLVATVTIRGDRIEKIVYGSGR